MFNRIAAQYVYFLVISPNVWSEFGVATWRVEKNSPKSIHGVWFAWEEAENVSSFKGKRKKVIIRHTKQNEVRKRKNV